jgi:hypothetical protein
MKIMLLATVGLTAILPARLASAATLHVGPGAQYTQPSAAIAAAGAGDTVAIAPGQYFDCAFVRVPHLTIEGVGDAATGVLTDKACGGKVPDGNGAGIRMEGGNLTVDHVRFVNNQDGILTAAGPSWVLTVTNSVFDRNGSCTDACAHGIYAGAIGKLIVRDSHFTATKQAHHIKSRALFTEVTGSTIEDGPAGTASYLIEAPNGGSLIVRGNTLEKGPMAENHSAAIIIGDEGVTQPTGEITIENNVFTNDMTDHRTAFVSNDTATEAVLRGNRLHGAVDALKGDGSSN